MIKIKKKLFLTFALAICLMVPAMFMLSACGHSHKAVAEWSSDATYHWHACEEENCKELLDKAEHSWNAGVITTEATFEQDGVKTYTCSVCGETRTESVAYSNYIDMNFVKSTETQTKVAFTISEAGTYYFRYTVEVPGPKDGYYWICLTKTDKTLQQTDTTHANAKIYNENKQVIKTGLETQAAGQFMAVRPGSGEGYDDQETVVNLMSNGVKYLELPFVTPGDYEIVVVHFSQEGTYFETAATATYDDSEGAFNITRTFKANQDYFIKIVLTQDILNKYEGYDLSGGLWKDSSYVTEGITIKIFDSNYTELDNEGATGTLSASGFTEGTYYIVVNSTTAQYLPLHLAFC
ncbi:MAG: hypothetical protein ACI4PF_07035 [Christensenellales bacterium]